ncbi:hypothetical protein EGW08_020363 [Elysia chlorotica]|uniref:Uncharacterized protein n=1 Tax=Elysia chlorotica TaxID=188477 RepID=A0A3S1H475_ELYCH|nr:hypothetical protein EGW08_020363 [Elysia chlorotica]
MFPVFEELCYKNEQTSTTVITVNKVKQRRSRREEDEAEFHSYSYQYQLLIAEDSLSKTQICFKAVLSIFGITKSRLERIQKALTSTGLPPIDGRGKHGNRPRAFTDVKIQSIIDHIRSFRGRQSHYTLRDSKKLYLPEELNVTKMHEMYMAEHPGETCSRESYRRVFVEKFNVTFGYPRKDTCSSCDSFKVELSKELPADELRRLAAERELHWRKSQVFYERKTAAAQEAQSSLQHAAAAFDFWKNFQCPNISTNDVYYKRQLSLFTFNVHDLGTGEVHLFPYDETVGRKGANDMASMLLFLFNEILPKEVTHLQLFCDSCPGQNKNWTMLRFLHFMVHTKKRFDTSSSPFR